VSDWLCPGEGLADDNGVINGGDRTVASGLWLSDRIKGIEGVKAPEGVREAKAAVAEDE